MIIKHISMLTIFPVLVCTSEGSECGSGNHAECNTAADSNVCKCSAGYSLKDGVCSGNGTISLSCLHVCIVTQLLQNSNIKLSILTFSASLSSHIEMILPDLSCILKNEDKPKIPETCSLNI